MPCRCPRAWACARPPFDLADAGGLWDAALGGKDAQSLRDRLRRDGIATEFETTVMLADGEERQVVLAAAVTPSGPSPNLVAALVDVTDRRAAERQARYAASHDALTGLPNRAAFHEGLEAARARR